MIVFVSEWRDLSICQSEGLWWRPPVLRRVCYDCHQWWYCCQRSAVLTRGCSMCQFSLTWILKLAQVTVINMLKISVWSVRLLRTCRRLSQPLLIWKMFGAIGERGVTHTWWETLKYIRVWSDKTCFKYLSYCTGIWAQILSEDQNRLLSVWL